MSAAAITSTVYPTGAAAVSASSSLTHSDIERLIHERSGYARGEIAEKICRDFNANTLSAHERDVALDIFRLLIRDAEIRVRKTIAAALKDNLSVPHDIIFDLANDAIEVAGPVLEHSFVLSENDLMQLAVSSTDVARLMAIAKRETLSKPLSHVLIETREHKVIQTVVLNRGAALSDTSLTVLLDEYKRNEGILEALVYRGGLPYAFAERLFAAVSENLKKQLTKRYRFSASQAESTMQAARETATLQFLSPWMTQQDIVNLVTEMARNKRLTSSVVIRSLCIGDLRFFETAIAILAGIPVSNARILMLDPGPLGFKALYDSAHLPADYLPAVKLMLSIALEETDYGDYRASDFCQRMIERITSEGHDKRVPHMSTLLTMVGRAVHDGRTLH